MMNSGCFPKKKIEELFNGLRASLSGKAGKWALHCSDPFSVRRAAHVPEIRGAKRSRGRGVSIFIKRRKLDAAIDDESAWAALGTRALRCGVKSRDLICGPASRSVFCLACPINRRYFRSVRNQSAGAVEQPASLSVPRRETGRNACTVRTPPKLPPTRGAVPWLALDIRGGAASMCACVCAWWSETGCLQILVSVSKSEHPRLRHRGKGGRLLEMLYSLKRRRSRRALKTYLRSA